MNHSKENKHLVKIFDLSRNGPGVGKLDNGMTVFVPFSCPGDEVWIEIIEEKKKYCFAKITKIHKASEMRVIPPCRVFTECGGCDWQHIPYPLQWETKTKGVLSALERNGFHPSPKNSFFPATEPWRYRNRIQLHVQNEKIGFYKKKSKELVSIDDCPITKKEITDKISEFSKKNLQGVEKIEMELLGSEVRSALNQPHAFFGFRQIHDIQNENLKTWIKEQLSSTTSHSLVELFGGSGNLSFPLRSLYTTLHSVDSHISDALHSLDQMKFYEMKVDDWLRKIAKNLLPTLPSYDLLLDPPRSGLGEQSLSWLNQILQQVPPKNLIWVGCDPLSWAKEITTVIHSGAKVEELSFFDFFPQTTHIESAAHLKF